MSIGFFAQAARLTPSKRNAKMFTLKFNDTPDHADCDWLVLRNGQFVAGFASSNAAERFIIEREAELASAIFAKPRGARSHSG
jgi:hypothetical protein